MAKTTRHGSIADQLQALLAYRNRPDGVEEGCSQTNELPSQIGTNWKIVADNDNAVSDAEGTRLERLLEITPSIQQIARSLAGVEFDDRGNPIGGDIERDGEGRITRLGHLHFSDGGQTEKAFKLTVDGKVVQYDRRLPVGAMVGAQERLTMPAGGAGSQSVGSNRYFADLLDTRAARFVAGKRKRRTGRSYTARESAEMLREATANTNMAKVTFTKFPAGLPCGAPKVSDSFLGMKKTTCSGGGAVGWEDLASSIAEREVWMRALADLSDADRKTLSDAAKAGSLADIGGAGDRRASERRGMRRLMAANDNLLAAMKKVAA